MSGPVRSPLLDFVPVPGRTFVRGERCANCRHFERGERAVQHFVAVVSRRVRAAITPELLAMRLYSWIFTRNEQKLAEVRAHLSIAPGDVLLSREEMRLRRRLHAMRAGGRLEICKRVIEAHGEQRALESGENDPEGGELLAFANIAPDFVRAFGIEDGEITITNCAVGDRGLCRKGAPSKYDSKGSDFVDGGYKCHMYAPVPGLVPDDDGPESDLPQEVEMAMDSVLKKEE